MATKKTKKEHKYATEEAFESLEHTVQSGENFLEKNAKILAIVFGALILVAVGYFAYLKFYIDPRNEEAQNEIVTADTMFEQDSMQLALNGSPGAYMGYNQILNEYKGTDLAKIAEYKAGIANYQLGNYQEALENFKKFNTSEVALKAIKEGATGDTYVQLGKKEEALSAYEQAIKASDLQVLEKIYTKKYAILAHEMGANDKAYNKVKEYLEKYNDAPDNELNRLEALFESAQK